MLTQGDFFIVSKAASDGCCEVGDEPNWLLCLCANGADGNPTIVVFRWFYGGDALEAKDSMKIKTDQIADFEFGNLCLSKLIEICLRSLAALGELVAYAAAAKAASARNEVE